MFMLKNIDIFLVKIGWMQQFNIWDLPMNRFCPKIKTNIREGKSQIRIQRKFPWGFQPVCENTQTC